MSLQTQLSIIHAYGLTRSLAVQKAHELTQFACYQHKGREGNPYGGLDFLGVIMACYKAATGDALPEPDDYTPDYVDEIGPEWLTAFMDAHFERIAVEDSVPGDILTFRMSPKSIVKHAAVKTDRLRIVHSYFGRACTQSALTDYWQSRTAGAYRIPAVKPSPSTSVTQTAILAYASGDRDYNNGAAA